jgi:hypothetical protein
MTSALATVLAGRRKLPSSVELAFVVRLLERNGAPAHWNKEGSKSETEITRDK